MTTRTASSLCHRICARLSRTTNQLRANATQATPRRRPRACLLRGRVTVFRTDIFTLTHSNSYVPTSPCSFPRCTRARTPSPPAQRVSEIYSIRLQTSPEPAVAHACVGGGGVATPHLRDPLRPSFFRVEEQTLEVVESNTVLVQRPEHIVSRR